MELHFANWMCAFVRAGAFLGILPVFSTPNVPVRFRLALAALLAMLCVPVMEPGAASFGSVGGLAGALVRETAAGAAMGLVGRMVFYAADFAARIAANELGLNMGALLDPFSGGTTQAPGMLLFLLAAMLMLTLDIHHWLLLAFQGSFAVLPPGSARFGEGLFLFFSQQTSRVIASGVQMAAPLIGVSFVIVLVMAVLGRAVPQMNVFSESFPARILGGLLVFGLVLQLMAQHIVNYLRALPEDMARLVQILAAG
jgi:flagellar biosynthetic protein FliR